MNTLEVSHVVKEFGTHRVLDDISFEVPEHSVFAFLGQNGAGKTTTMKLILGLMKMNAGEIRVCNEPVQYGKSSGIGYLPDVPEFYSYMSAAEYLNFCGQVQGMRGNDLKKQQKELLDLVGLANSKKRIKGYSRGMKQRLGIAQALLGNPKILICDEPTSALDPVGRKEILDILYEIKGKTTVIFSTHILSDVERICDHMAVLHNGKIALSGTIEDVKKSHPTNRIRISFSSEEKRKAFELMPEVREWEKYKKVMEDELIFHTRRLEEAQKMIYASIEKSQIFPEKVELLESDLESLFLEVVE